MRLYGGAADVTTSARYYDGGGSSVKNGGNIVENDSGDENNDTAARGGAITVAKDNINRNRHHVTSRKMYLSPQMMEGIKDEIEALPLPATLASIATALLNSKIIWEAYDATDIETLDINKNYNNSDDDNDEQSVSKNNSSSTPASDFDDLSKYFSGITIDDQEQKRKDAKLQFDSLCKELITRGNHVMLTQWEEVQDRLGEEFLFAKLLPVVDDDNDDAAVEKEGTIVETTAVEEAKVEMTPAKAYATTPMSKRRRGHLKVIPKKSHYISPKSTERRKDIKLKRTFKKFVRGTKKKAAMGLDVYKQLLLDKMGKNKFNQIFQQATCTPTKQLQPLLDDHIKGMDDNIKKLEAERRKTRKDELLAKAEQERQARESASKLLRPLTPEETQIVKSAIYGIGPPDEILSSQGADSVQRQSMHRLQPRQWLNDEVINYFLKNCLAKRDEKLCAKDTRRKRSHFFNSFFVQTMFDEKNDNPNLRGRYNYKNVKRWSKKVPGKDVFNLRYIFCPVNLDNAHWTSACIFMEKKKIQYFDSFGGTDWSKLKGLLEYLKDEWRAKKGGEMDTSEWELVGCQESTPRQNNGQFFL